MKILVNGYTVTEHLKLKKQNSEITDLNRAIGYLRTNKKQWYRLILITALIIPQTTLSAYAAGGIIDTGLEIYKYIKDAVYVVSLLGAATEGIKCVVTGTVEQLGQIAVKYIALVLMINFLPKIIDIIFAIGGK
ncbi:MAG: hypothetical protein IJH55_06855 [Romboutsia sp.]|nr:hypothetical protein [Romboutsia sp.]